MSARRRPWTVVRDDVSRGPPVSTAAAEGVGRGGHGVVDGFGHVFPRSARSPVGGAAGREEELTSMADGSNLILGSEDNSASNRTSVTKDQGFLPVMDLFNDHGVGLLIIAGESVVHGGGQPSQGEALAAFSPGTAVVGTGDECGVFGTGAETGVDALCNAGVGVRGVTRTGVGVRGQSTSGLAVHAQSASGVGLYATSAARPAVVAASLRDTSVVGVSQARHGLVGFAQQTGTGVIGVSAHGFAGEFYGAVRVLGDFMVIGGSKSAVVPHRDGSYRQLYTLESPEPWFEDFGRAELRRGKATVPLRADFAAVIDGKAVHVFLSPEGDCNGLYISGQSGKAFSVRERRRGTSSLTFSYRVVGRRKDIRGERMKRISVPRERPAPSPAPDALTIEPRQARAPSFYRGRPGDR
jgi:hypothetical protein